VICLDSSVALAHLLAEELAPPPEIWTHDLVSSRLFACELMNRTHARGLGEPAMIAARTSVTQLTELDVNGDAVLDTSLMLSDGAVVRLLGVSGVSDWHALL
jgi:hypothetical protein